MRLPWTVHGQGRAVAADAIVRPEERLSWPRTIGIGAQHVVAMFGATFLVPVLTGFPPSTTLLFSGIGTLLFLIITRNRLPSYLGSSFALIAPITAATASHGQSSALLGVVAVGLLLLIIGVIVQLAGTRWLDALMPPVVAGAIVALIGFNLAPAAKNNFEAAPVTALITLFAVIITAVLFRGLIGRLSIFVGVIIGYLAAVIRGEVDFSAVAAAPWVGLPQLQAPANPFAEPGVWLVIPAFLPVVLALVAENVGHVRGVAQLTDPSVNKLTGRALIADGLATMIAGSGGGSGTTTYGENIGVMAATRVYSTAAYWVAGLVAIALGLSPKLGAVINTVPAGVLGGVTTALYGLIGIIGVKIWLDNKVDFTKPANQFTAAVALIIGVGDFTLSGGNLSVAGIALGSIAAIVVYHLMTLITRLRGAGAGSTP
ncbi:uracil-xanthine permease family protein [Microlunatus parietis]|uniref:NCS2 family nucleobase:cation symporter-2 n=1 Tax=Microlunatus parietis TaxID=682979 RepID=A0A7Y9IAA7_9ACTN|nr:solute carrier family 23 protein [Microlunatus parietis]NYE73179.1 NCS2 family nucleobase:cation symporter-2 [Microlunatus parietis]